MWDSIFAGQAFRMGVMQHGGQYSARFYNRLAFRIRLEPDCFQNATCKCQWYVGVSWFSGITKSLAQRRRTWKRCGLKLVRAASYISRLPLLDFRWHLWQSVWSGILQFTNARLAQWSANVYRICWSLFRTDLGSHGMFLCKCWPTSNHLPFGAMQI